MAAAAKRSVGKTKRKPTKIIVKRAVGRPPKYDAQYHCDRGFTYGLLGLTDIEIAGKFEIPEGTFYRWRNEHPEFREALEKGKLPADGEVAKSLYQRATGQAKRAAVKVFAPAGATSADDLIYAPYVETSFADVGAAKLWLTNRQPQKWRERREIEVSGSLEHRISQMSPDERLQRLRELQAKAALIIEGEASEVVDGQD